MKTSILAGAPIKACRAAQGFPHCLPSPLMRPMWVMRRSCRV
jgi:hypothetical protein